MTIHKLAFLPLIHKYFNNSIYWTLIWYAIHCAKPEYVVIMRQMRKFRLIEAKLFFKVNQLKCEKRKI